MRIAYVINSLEGGGASSPVPAIANLIRTEGAEVRILALTPRDLLGLPAMHAAGLDVVVRNGEERDHLEAYRWLDRAIADWEATHIWTSLTRATLIGQMVGLRRFKPVISWQHAAYLKPANLRLLRATQRLSKLWIGDSECVTELTAERLRVGPDRLMSWPIFSVDPAALPAAPWIAGQPIRVGSLGRLHPVKGYDILLNALAILKAAGFRSAPFEIIIGGEGHARPALEAAIRGYGLDNVSLPGFVESPGRFLAGVHLYVQPSRSEGFCIATHEAMQAGIGVVASAVGEMQHSVDVLCGLTVPPENPQALANALAKVLRYPEMLEQLGQAAKRRVRARFGAEAFARRGREVLQKINSW
jgi:glycosyltransferase involved in cell wall biosynthesis